MAGYDHERSPREEKLMFLREDRILAAVAKARGKDAGSRA